MKKRRFFHYSEQVSDNLDSLKNHSLKEFRLTVFPLYKEYNLGITVYSEDIKIGEVKWLIRECKSFFKFISITIKEAEEKAKSVDNKVLRSERDLIEEVLSLTRELSINRRFERERIFHPRAFEDMIGSVERLIETVCENGNFELIEYIRDLHRTLKYFVEEAMNSSPGVRKELYSRYRRSKMLVEELIILPEKRVASRVRKTKHDSDEITAPNN